MKKLFFLAFAAFVVVACSDDDPIDEPFVVCPHGSRISFELTESLQDHLGNELALETIDVYSFGNLDYSVENVVWPKPYATDTDEYDQYYWQGVYIFALNRTVMFGGYYDDGTLWDMDGEKVTDNWGGFVLSRNSDCLSTEADYKRQFHVWAHGGANDTNTFAVGYDANTASAGYMESKAYNSPQINFSKIVRPYRVFLANSTYTYPYFSGKDTDRFVVKITGWKDDVEGETVSCPLIEGANKVSDWVMMDISVLGEVNKLTFTVQSSDSFAPLYFCLDDLCFD